MAFAPTISVTPHQLSQLTVSVFDQVEKKVTKSGINAKPLLQSLLAKKEEFVTHDGTISNLPRLSYKGSWVTIGGAQPAIFNRQDSPVISSYPVRRKQTGNAIAVEKMIRNGIKVETHSPTGRKNITAVKQAALRIYEVLQDELEAWMEGYNDDLQLNFWRNGIENPDWGFPGITGFLLENPELGNIGGISGALYPAWRNVAYPQITVDSDRTLRWYVSQTYRDVLVNNRSATINTSDYLMLCGTAFHDTIMAEDIRLGQSTQVGWQRKADIGTGDTNPTSPYKVYTHDLTLDPYLDTIGKSNFCYMIHTGDLKFCCSSVDNMQTHMPEPEYNDFDNWYIGKTFTGGMKANRLERCAVISIQNGILTGKPRQIS